MRYVDNPSARTDDVTESGAGKAPLNKLGALDSAWQYYARCHLPEFTPCFRYRSSNMMPLLTTSVRRVREPWPQAQEPTYQKKVESIYTSIRLLTTPTESSQPRDVAAQIASKRPANHQASYRPCRLLTWSTQSQMKPPCRPCTLSMASQYSSMLPLLLPMAWEYLEKEQARFSMKNAEATRTGFKMNTFANRS
jgi:hypothetical protein